MKSLLLVIALLGGTNCGSGPATSPAPPVEIPSFITVPDTVAISTNAIASSTNLAPPTKSVSKALASGGTYSSTIATTKTLQDVGSDFVDAILAIVANLRIPISTTITACEFTSTGGVCNDGTTIDVRKNSEVKVDLAIFDIDGNGSEGCSGNACPVNCSAVSCSSGCPSSITSESNFKSVCLRLWAIDRSDSLGTGNTTTYQPLIAIRYDRVPSPILNSSNNVTGFNNIGAGTLKVATEYVDETTFAQDVNVDARAIANYDHVDSDSAKKSTEVLIVSDWAYTSAPSFDFETRFRYSKIEQATTSFSDGTSDVLQTLRIDDRLTNNNTATTQFIENIGRFLKDGIFWRGTNSSTITTDRDFTNLCVDLRTGEQASASADSTCSKLSVTGLTLGSPAASAATFPTDFPADPCDTCHFDFASDCPNC
ncbi:MAG: hypothetical protein Q7S68_00900 [Deltaproteobacteria bacterium]|nr:hypothetical protein [Deltaproteobacteria bacterium]